MYAAFIYSLLFLIASVRYSVQSKQISNLHAPKAPRVGIQYISFFCLLGFYFFFFLLPMTLCPSLNIKLSSGQIPLQ